MSFFLAELNASSTVEHICCLMRRIEELEQSRILDRDNLLFYQCATVGLIVLLTATILIAAFVTPYDFETQPENETDSDDTLTIKHIEVKNVNLNF